MLEYIILFLFIVLLFYPLQMSPLAKVLELVLVVYAGYKSPLIGLFCAIVFMYSISLSLPIKAPSTPLSIPMMSEMVRPKESNSAVCTEKTTEAVYLPHEPYQAYNVEV